MKSKKWSGRGYGYDDGESSGYRIVRNPPSKESVCFAKAKAHATNYRYKVGMPTIAWSPAKVTEESARHDAEAAMRERVQKAVDILAFGVTELIESPVPKRWDPGVNIQMMINLIQALCVSVTPAIPKPSFRGERKPVTSRICDNCGEKTKEPICPFCGASV